MAVFRYLLILTALASGVCAQNAPSAAAPAASNGPFVTPIPSVSSSAAPAATPPPPANRQISSGTAALLAQSVPTYHPPPAAPVEKPNLGDTDDSTEDNEQPENHVIRLPKYIVHEQQPPIFREKDLYDKDGLRRLALLRYRGLSLFPFARLNGPIADEMYREDDRLKSIADFNQTADAIAAGGDTAEADYIRKETQSTYAQSVGWGDPTPQNPSGRSSP
jgi:hypothetical protein